MAYGLSIRVYICIECRDNKEGIQAVDFQPATAAADAGDVCCGQGAENEMEME